VPLDHSVVILDRLLLVSDRAITNSLLIEHKD